MIALLTGDGFRTRSGFTPDGWCAIYFKRDIVGGLVAEYDA